MRNSRFQTFIPTLIVTLFCALSLSDFAFAEQSPCAEGSFVIAEFPEELPLPSPVMCANTPNEVKENRIISQIYTLKNISLEDFEEDYIERMTRGGWVFNPQDKAWLGPSKLIRHFEADHAHGYTAQLFLNDLSPKFLSAYKGGGGFESQISLKVVLIRHPPKKKTPQAV